MSDHIIARTGRIADSQATLPWLVAAGMYLVLIVLGHRLLADPDSYSHIALGRWILEHHAVPTTDPLSLTMRGVHWVAFEWLSQVAYAIALALGGWTAVAALAALAAATSFGLLTRFLLRDWQPTPTIIAVLAGFVLTAPHILARPHMLAMPLMVAWVALLIRAADDKQAPPWHLIPLMTLWANLHGSFTFGLAITGAIALDALWNAAPSERLKVVRQWGVFGLLALGAACINPYGPEMILVTFKTIALGQALQVIVEWRPQDFNRLGPYEIIMLGGFGLALLRGVKLPLMRIVMLFGLLHLSLAQSRHADLLGLLAPLFLARPLAGQFAAIAKEQTFERMQNGMWAAVTAAFILLGATAFAATRHDIVPAANITPAKAVQAVGLAKLGPVLNEYGFGGYLDFIGIAPFIDGRTELYGTDFTIRYDLALKLENLPDFLRLLDEYKFGVTILAPRTPAVALLDRLPEWQRIYTDDIAVVHKRR